LDRRDTAQQCWNSTIRPTSAVDDDNGMAWPASIHCSHAGLSSLPAHLPATALQLYVAVGCVKLIQYRHFGYNNLSSIPDNAFIQCVKAIEL
jgi:hypothetical protein